MLPLRVTTKIGLDTSGNGVEAEMSKMSTAPVDMTYSDVLLCIPHTLCILHVDHIWWYTKLRLYLMIYTSIKSSKNGRHRPYLHCFPTGGWTRQVVSGFASRHLIGGQEITGLMATRNPQKKPPGMYTLED